MLLGGPQKFKIIMTSFLVNFYYFIICVLPYTYHFVHYHDPSLGCSEWVIGRVGYLLLLPRKVALNLFDELSMIMLYNLLRPPRIDWAYCHKITANFVDWKIWQMFRDVWPAGFHTSSSTASVWMSEAHH